MAAPGGALASTEIHRPTAPSTAASTTLASCQGRRRENSSRVVAAGTTSSAVARSAPMAESAAIATRATRASSAASGRAERTPSARAEVGSKPATVQRWPSSSGPGDHGDPGSGRPEHVGRPDDEQAAEEQVLDVGAGVEDVGGEDHPHRQRGHEDERGAAVVAVAIPPRQPPDAGGDHGRGGGGAEMGGEAEPVGEHEAGEGRGAHRVRVEGQAAQDDPRAHEPGADRQHADLEQASLDERQVERLEHPPHGTRL